MTSVHETIEEAMAAINGRGPGGRITDPRTGKPLHASGEDTAPGDPDPTLDELAGRMFR